MVALAIGLAVGANLDAAGTDTNTGLAAIGAAAHPASRTPAVSATTRVATYRQLVANIKAAEKRHDFAAQARFASQLNRVLTAPTIGAIYLERARLVSTLETVTANGEYRGAARINQRLAALCGPKAVKAQLEFCN